MALLKRERHRDNTVADPLSELDALGDGSDLFEEASGAALLGAGPTTLVEPVYAVEATRVYADTPVNK